MASPSSEPGPTGAVPSDVAADTTPPLLQQLLSAPTVLLRYSIAKASSYSGTYHPNNILYNRPHDMGSRWSGSSQHAQSANSSQGSSLPSTASAGPMPSSSSPSTGTGRSAAATPSRKTASSPSSAPQSIVATPANSGSSKQYIILKLDKPCLVRSITFGKYHKPHPCNVRDFKIYGSLYLDSLLPPSSGTVHRAPPAVKRLIRGGLRNDATHETFELRWFEDVEHGSDSATGFGLKLAPGEGELDRRGVSQALVASGNAIPFALQYIKIVPLAAHTPNYNFSVWYVALSGVSDAALVSKVMSDYADYRESATIRLVLKHLREQGHHTAFAALLQSSRLSAAQVSFSTSAIAGASRPSAAKRPFEHPLLTNLFDALVRHGSWDEVEACLDKAAFDDPAAVLASAPPSSSSSTAQIGSASVQNLAASAAWDPSGSGSMFSSYIAKQKPRADWHRILPAQPINEAQPPLPSLLQTQQSEPPLVPSGRGGHSMVFDSDKGIAYLFGGWDGFQDLCDLWSFHVNENRWRQISPDVRLQGGPGPRSCHKMCLDARSGSIYFLGRYIDYESPSLQRESARTGSPASPAGASSTFAASPSPSSAAATAAASAAATARSTRASFLAQVPGSAALPSQRDVPMAGMDASSQTGETETSAMGTPQAGGGRPRRLDQLGADLNEIESSNSAPSSSPTASLPVRPSRVGLGSRTPSRNVRLPPSPTGMEPDFYRFSIRWERWEKLSSDTYADGGPKLVYDHGLVIDSQNQMLYVFGGRVADPDPNKFEFSGMWRYDIIQRVWTFLFDDNTSSSSKILSRSGHSMLLDPGRTSASGMSASQNRQIWILGGHRGASATNLADMWTYNIATGAVREISNNTAQNGPGSGFTQRATIDPMAREISLFVGLIGGRDDRKKSSAFWIYSIPWGTWKQVYRYEEAEELARAASAGAESSTEAEAMSSDRFGDRQGETDYDGDEVPESGPLQALPVYDDDEAEDDDMVMEGPADSWVPYTGSSLSGSQTLLHPRSSPLTRGDTPTRLAGQSRSGLARAGAAEIEPRPRYAAQLVFDDRNKVYYLHGGNPEDPEQRQLRLDDLWRLTLMRPTPGEVLRRAKFRVRQRRFLEMTRAISLQGADGADVTTLGLEALMYLQSEVAAVVDHSNEVESKLFRKLMTYLLNAKTASDSTPMGTEGGEGAGDLEADRTLTSQGAGAMAATAVSAEPDAHAAAASGAATPGESSMRIDRAAPMSAKRGRDELEAEEDESSRSPISMYASSAGDGDSEMLSISQVLPARAKRGTAGLALKGNDVVGEAGAAVSVKVSETEGRPSALYAERKQLFRSLLEYFNAEVTEPRVEISNCIEAALGG